MGDDDDFKLLDDFANQANEGIGRYRIEFILAPDKLTKDEYALDQLEWKSIAYGDDGALNQVPDDKRGIYAFTICWPHAVLPPHCYVLYVGIAGRDSQRSLRARYKDYLNLEASVRSRKLSRVMRRSARPH